jgi:hypothetical protein
VTLEILLVREDGQRGGSGFFITASDGERIEVLSDGAGGG